MFFLIGIGLKAEHLTLEALATAKKCSKVFLESYTSQWPSWKASELEKLIGKQVTVLGRKHIEEHFTGTLEEAKSRDIALLVPGNPLTATTHVQLLLDAKNAGVAFSFVPGISITDFLGSTGLDAYRFGRIVTIVAPKENYEPESFYGMIEANKKLNVHTLCLLEFDAENGFFMRVQDAVKILEAIEAKKKKSVVKNSLLVGLYGVGGEEQKILAGNAIALKEHVSNAVPQSLIVCAELNEKEKEAVRELALK